MPFVTATSSFDCSGMRKHPFQITTAARYLIYRRFSSAFEISLPALCRPGCRWRSGLRGGRQSHEQPFSHPKSCRLEYAQSSARHFVSQQRCRSRSSRPHSAAASNSSPPSHWGFSSGWFLRPAPAPTSPGEAADIAFIVQESMRAARREYGNIGTVHFFIAAPAGLAVMIGQLLNTFGSVQTYEHVTTDGSGHYRPAALLKPTA